MEDRRGTEGGWSGLLVLVSSVAVGVGVRCVVMRMRMAMVMCCGDLVYGHVR
jgi:hypothetical protein